MRVEDGFQQQPLQLQPAYTNDPALRFLLERVLPSPIFKEVEKELKQFEQRLAGPIRQLAAVGDTFPSSVEPYLEQYDQWGQRVDRLHTSEGWRVFKGVAAEEGLVAIAQEREEGEHARTRSFAKTFLFYPDSLIVGCPISMTDGAARVIEIAGTEEMRREILPRLCSRDPKTAWTSGQWMTERPGGSDVSLTETTATPVDSTSPPTPGSPFLLNGFKWFSSATDGDIALALARTGGPGSKGLSLFLVKLRDQVGKTNGVFVHRLKKKWGTKALPTAELSLVNTVGHLLGPLGAGVRTISFVLNITRLHSAITSASALRRGIDLAKSFAAVRHIGGDLARSLKDDEMHTSALAKSEVTQRALLHLSFGVARLLGRSEALEIGDGKGMFSRAEKWRLRLLTPVIKSFCAELGTSELPRLMEALGGQGYMVENQFGRIIQDANVERIWEGTTSVLALDVLRVISQTNGAAIDHFVAWAEIVLISASALPSLAGVVDTLTSRLALLRTVSSTLLVSPAGSSLRARFPRPFLFLLGYVTSAMYLLEQAVWSATEEREEKETDEWVVKTWVEDGGVWETVSELERVLNSSEGELHEVRNREREAVYGREKL